MKPIAGVRVVLAAKSGLWVMTAAVVGRKVLMTRLCEPGTWRHLNEMMAPLGY